MTNYLELFKNCENLQYFSRKHGESIWGKDKDGNYQILIHNFLNFNTVTFLGTLNNTSHSEVLESEIFEKIKKII
jgi:hypothetical protein